MAEFTKTELEEAQKAIASVISKSEKAQEKLAQQQPPSKPQLTLLDRRLRALRLAMSLIARELESHNT